MSEIKEKRRLKNEHHSSYRVVDCKAEKPYIDAINIDRSIKSQNI